MRGRAEAMMAVSVLVVLSLVFLPPTNVIASMLSSTAPLLSSATLVLVTLRKGAYEGMLVLASAGLAATATIKFVAVAVPGWIPIALVLGLWLPIWLIAIVLREGRHLSLAVHSAVFLGIVVVIGHYLGNDDPASIWRELISSKVPPDLQIENKEQMVAQTAALMTGIIAAGGVFSILLALCLGRWWQALLYNPGGFSKEFLALKSQPKVAIITLIMVAIMMLSSGKIGEVALNSTIIMLVLYFFVGIAVLHLFFAKMQNGKLAVPMFYITLVVMAKYSLVPVALIGFSDTWLDIRNKWLT